MGVAETVTNNVVLPNPRYEKTWDSIIVQPEIKDRLLRWAVLSLRMRAELPFEATALHGLVLLYGPPGTGKTTLARGLAQRLAPLMAKRKVRLIELNPHGLMSAEHGQSQQKVAELLTQHVPALADDGLPTVVLLDEVESMAVARSEASLSANPADVHRATDAVLTALDDIATRHPHLLVVATSNFTGALDAAFLSRADVAIEVPAPDAEAALAILSCVLRDMSAAFPALLDLAEDTGLKEVAGLLAGTDGRQIRKTVTEAMAARLETVQDPGRLTAGDLRQVAMRATSAKANVIGGHRAAV
ncbi:AAA family ATPase [Hamadaea sp. NPDC051192]|uniref:AAA family ATPase n=1 Tax=Hamadaea sp. NPDC051192 TaxID=3154940 RepID=UPI00344AE43B